MPPLISNRKYIDMTQTLIRARYHTSNAFLQQVAEIVRRIESVAMMVHQRQVGPNCDNFSLPPESIFAKGEEPVIMYPVTNKVPPAQ